MFLLTFPPVRVILWAVNARLAQLVERQPSKLNVVGSCPISRSIINNKYKIQTNATVAQLVEQRTSGKKESPFGNERKRTWLIRRTLNRKACQRRAKSEKSVNV